MPPQRDTRRRKKVSNDLLRLGGSQNLRTYWNQYLKKTHFLVFVVDSTDDIRLQLARHELHRLLEGAPQLPLMVLANKQVNKKQIDYGLIQGCGVGKPNLRLLTFPDSLICLTTEHDCRSALGISDISSELSLHRIEGLREVTLLGTSAVYDGYGNSTSIQTVRSMLEEKLHKIQDAEANAHHHATSLAGEKSA
ncbi:unnamed protein product [Ranitomeya imitator]|uniref:ADP-ribosylation factor-like protein 9 n=1 Tax=Ranitomeya imitator TaxID=111125 RepID=A0ABN9MHP6_9NEOB|nr:unnamed protein product [Ranitomeya imitator]